MHKPTNYYSPQMVVQLSRLLEQVQAEIMAFEDPAANCADKHLNETIRLVSQECRQHAAELMAYIHCLGGKPPLTVLNISIEPDQSQSFMSNNEILQRLRAAEQRLLATYRASLNEPLFTHDIRAILRRQFNSLVYSFLQTKLFDAAH